MQFKNNSLYLWYVDMCGRIVAVMWTIKFQKSMTSHWKTDWGPWGALGTSLGGTQSSPRGPHLCSICVDLLYAFRFWSSTWRPHSGRICALTTTTKQNLGIPNNLQSLTDFSTLLTYTLKVLRDFLSISIDFFQICFRFVWDFWLLPCPADAETVHTEI